MEVPLANGRGVALIDLDDLELVSRYNWCLRGQRNKRYAGTRIRDRIVRMHRLLMPDAPGEIDHIDGDGLNNRRGNLRGAGTHAENLRNQKLHCDSTSGFKGVSFRKSDRCWRAYIVKDYRQVWLGRYDSVLEAAMAYDRAALVLHGEFGRTNYPPGAYTGVW